MYPARTARRGPARSCAAAPQATRPPTAAGSPRARRGRPRAHTPPPRQASPAAGAPSARPFRNRRSRHAGRGTRDERAPAAGVRVGPADAGQSARAFACRRAAGGGLVAGRAQIRPQRQLLSFPVVAQAAEDTGLGANLGSRCTGRRSVSRSQARYRCAFLVDRSPQRLEHLVLGEPGVHLGLTLADHGVELVRARRGLCDVLEFGL